MHITPNMQCETNVSLVTTFYVRQLPLPTPWFIKVFLSRLLDVWRTRTHVNVAFTDTTMDHHTKIS